MGTLTNPKSRNVNKLRVTISISPTMLAKTDARAEEQETTRSAVIQMALREYLAKS